MKQTIITLEESLGLPLSHDLTLIDPENKYKGARFKRGHMVTHDDVKTLRRMGREHLSVLELEAGEVHEDSAALRLADKFASPSFGITGPSEGRCNLTAAKNGLFLLDEQMVNGINDDSDWVLSTIANYSVVKTGDVVAAWRIGPLMMTEERVARAEKIADAAKVKFEITEFMPLKASLITTGAEIFRGEVEDAFIKKLPEKLSRYGAALECRSIMPDDRGAIAAEISKHLDMGVDVVLCTGGMSVDADDLTPAAIRDVCDEVIFKGTPVLPGSNLMLARKGKAFIFGVPACAVHADVTVLDVVMNRVFAGLPPELIDVRRWGVGGLCRSCKVCNFPICSFGSR